MIDNDKISSRQLVAFLILTMVGIGIFSLPRMVVETTKTDGWITTILGGIVALINFYIICRLAKRFPGDTLVEMAFKVLGKFLAIPVLLVVALYFLNTIAAVLRIFGEVVKMTLLIRTPIEIIMIALLILVLLLARSGIEAIVRFDEAIFIILFVLSIFGIILALPGADFTNLLPFMRTDVKDLLLGTFQTTYSYAGFELVLLIVPFIKKPDKIFRTGISAFVVVILTYSAAVILSIAYFGIAEVKQLIWPTLSLIRSIEVEGSFVERLEGVVMTQWVLFAFTSLVAYLYGASVLASRTIKNREFKHFCTILTPVVYLLAMMPDNVPQVYEILDKTIIYIGIPTLFIIPLLLLAVSSVRKLGVR